MNYTSAPATSAPATDRVITSFLAAAKKTTSIKWLVGAYLIHKGLRKICIVDEPDEHAISFALKHGVCFRSLHGEAFFCHQFISTDEIARIYKTNSEETGVKDVWATFNSIDPYCTPNHIKTSCRIMVCVDEVNHSISDFYIPMRDYKDACQAALVRHYIELRDCLSEVGIEASMYYQLAAVNKITKGLPPVVIPL